jgi:D-xylose transport system substrate-binding protein
MSVIGKLSVRRRCTIAAVLGAVALAAAGCGSGSSGSGGSGGSGGSDGSGAVAMLMSDNNTARWFQQDVPNVTRAVKKFSPGTKVLSYNAASSPDKQLTQARTAIGQGAKVLVVVSVDPQAAASIVKLAHDADVKVIAYEHQILKAPVDYYIGFDPLEVGHQEGKWMAENSKKGDGIVLINGWNATSLSHVFRKGSMKYLDPLIKSGDRKLVGEVFTPQWLADKAQAKMEAFLSKGDPIDAVLAQNDQMAGGVVAALEGAGMAGKVIVTGLDSDLAALQRIVKGTQAMSIHPQFGKEAQATAQIAASLLKGGKPPASVVGDRTLDNGIGGKVPWIVAPTIPIDKHNMQTVIDEGYVTKQELCANVPVTGPCAA